MIPGKTSLMISTSVSSRMWKHLPARMRASQISASRPVSFFVTLGSLLSGLKTILKTVNHRIPLKRSEKPGLGTSSGWQISRRRFPFQTSSL